MLEFGTEFAYTNYRKWLLIVNYLGVLTPEASNHIGRP